MLNYAIDYSRSRKAFGKPIFHHQAIAINLAEMKISVEASRLVLLGMMQSLELNQIDNSSAFFRQYLTDEAMRVSTEAIQVLGGHGLLHDHPVEKWARDIQMMRLFLF